MIVATELASSARWVIDRAFDFNAEYLCKIVLPQSHAVASRHNYSELTGYTLLHLAARL